MAPAAQPAPDTVNQALMAVVVVLVTAAAIVASASVVGLDGVSPWNIAFGISAGIVLVGGVRQGPAVIAGSLAGAWAIGWRSATGPGVWTVVLCAMLAVAAGAALRRFITPDPGSWGVRDVVTLIGVTLLAAAGAAGGVLVRALVGGHPAPDVAAYFTMAVGVAVGITLGVPAVASIARLLGKAPATHRAASGEVFLHASFTVAVGAAAYLLHGPTGERFWSLYFIPLLWTAFRLGMHGVIAAQAIVSVQALLLATLVATPESTLTNYHFMLFNFTVTGLLLAAALGARRQAERAASRSDALLAGAFRIMDDAVVLVRSADGTILDMNPAWIRLAACTREECVGDSLFAIPAWDAEAAGTMREHLRGRTPLRELSTRIRRPDGTVRDVVVVAETVASGAEAFSVVFVRDVTESRMFARQRMQSQKLEAVGLLASGVAHDFNNILTVVTTSGSMLRDEIPASDPRLEDVESILDAAARGAQLTRQLFAFSRHGSDEPARAHDASAVIGDMASMLGRLLGTGVKLEIDVAPGARVLAPPGQLEQVVLNLAVNARDAMDGSGTLRLSAAERALGEATFVPEVEGMVAAGRWVVIEVGDTGGGIDPVLLTRIFEPFFTTKPEGKGTGLGLATVYGIVQRVGGHLGVRSRVGEGTTFVVYWPAAPEVPSLVSNRVDG